MSTLVWIGFCQSLFAAILLLAKRKSSVSDRILSAWLCLLAIEFLTCALDNIIFQQPLLSSSFLLFNPALFLYVQSLTLSGFRLKWIQLLHLLPFVVFETLAYIIQEPFSLDGFFEPNHHLTFRVLFAVANLVSWLVYNPLSIVYVHRHRMHLRNEHSTIDKNANLGWVLSVSVFYVVYCIVAVILGVTAYLAHRYPQSPHFYNYSMLLFLVYVLSFYGLYQSELPQKMLQKPADLLPYKNSSLNAETKQLIHQKIKNYIEKEVAYLNPDLNMDMLSAALKIPKYQLTEVLNTEIGQNFFRFVNSYRVEAVKKMLSNPKNRFSIEAIGYECGFASKSAFYTVFKSLTGQTPVAFRDSLKS